MSWSGADFNRFSEVEERVNQPYDEVFISVVTLADEQLYIEHDEKLDFDEIGAIVGFVAGALAKMCAEHGK